MFTRFALVTVAIAFAAAATARAAIKVGDKPNLTLKLMDGKTVTSADLDGRMVILEFWATWCGPCIDQLPHLRKLHQTYSPRGVVLISISIDDSASVARRFAEKNRMVWPQAHDGTQPVPLSPAFAVRSIPHAVIISPDGEVLWKDHPADIDEALAHFLKKHPPRARRPSGPSAEVTDAVKAAHAAIDGKDIAALIAAIAALPDGAFDDSASQPALQALARRVTSPAVDQDALAAALTSKPQVTERVNRLKSLASTTNAADEVAPRISPALLQARLARAEAAKESGDHLEAYRGYTWVVEKGEGQPQQAQAAERVAAYHADASFMASLKQAEAADAAKAMLATARSYAESDRKDLAIATYEKLLADYPDFDDAKQAKDELATLKK